MPLRARRLTTPRLVLEPLRRDHAAEMVRPLADPALYRFIGGAPPSGDDLRRRYAIQVRGRSADGRQRWLNWIVRRRDDGHAIGFVQATVDVADDTADLAWVIGVPWQGRGFATAAAAAIVGALDRRITAHISPANRASEAVARRIGLEPTDPIEDGERVWQRPTRATA